MGGLLGGDGRHHVYKAALCRNSFDKKFHLPIAYYSHILPIYRKNRCCCGPVTPAAHCPTCGPHDVMEGEVIEMPETPAAAPTPAVIHSQPVLPGAVVPPRTQVRAVPAKRSTTRRVKTDDRIVQQSSTSGHTPMVLRREPAPVIVRQVSAAERRPVQEVPNPLR
jgi:hypothetical protein